MEVIYKSEALKDIAYWKKTKDKRVQNKIVELINDICEHPFTGKGKPEPLKHNLSGLWSRRITQEDRIIYEVEDGRINVLSLRGHY